MQNLFGALLVLAICILIFLAFRAIMLWYWKVDTIVSNQELTNTLLAENNALLSKQLSMMKPAIKVERQQES